MALRTLTMRAKKWPAKGSFRISRSALTAFDVVQCEITQGCHVGRSECRPYARYGETVDQVIHDINTFRKEIEAGIGIEELQGLALKGAAANLIDCALWDLRAKSSGRPIWDILGIKEPQARETAFTLSIDSPDKVAAAAKKAADFKLLKIKTAQNTSVEIAKSVIASRPDAKLIIDANEAMSKSELEALAHIDGRSQIALIEQPFPSMEDRPALFPSDFPLTVCADESLHGIDGLERVWEAGYRAVNVKLDKAGGLTNALALMKTAKLSGFKVMAGCMVGSSLAMAPMMILESLADYIDLDGPLLLSEDIDNGLKYENGIVHPPTTILWG